MVTFPSSIPLVSVVMGAYNSEATIEDAINSILSQDFLDVELIVVDDSSSDETPRKLSRITDPRLIVYRNPVNIGLTASLNVGIGLSRGKYIARQDADDVSDRTRLSTQVALLEANHDIGAAGTWVIFTDSALRPLSSWEPPITNLEIQRRLLQVNALCHGSAIVRRSLIDAVGLYREKFTYTQDYDLWLRIAEISELANIPQYLYTMRRGAGTISRKKLALQMYFHTLALHFARERRSVGSDSYDSMPGGASAGYLFETLKLSRVTYRKLKCDATRSYAREALMYRDYYGAMHLALQMFASKPALATAAEFADIYRRAMMALAKQVYGRNIGWRLKND